MIPTQLQTKCDFVLQEMGGTEIVASYIRERDVIETCMFGGPVFILKPYTISSLLLDKNITAGSFNPDYNYDFDVLRGIGSVGSIENFNRELYDLAYFGYRPNTYYSILDVDMHEVYKDICRPIRINGVKSHYFGFNEQDVTFLENSPHGSIIYIQFVGEKSPVLIKVIINKKPNPQKYTEYLISLSKEINNKKVIRDKESILRLPLTTKNPEVYILPKSLQSNPKTQHIFNDPNSYTYQAQSNHEIYLKITEDIWVAARELLPNLVTFPTVENRRISTALEALNADGYIHIDEEDIFDLETTKSDTLIFYKHIEDGNIAEMVLDVGRDGIVEGLKSCCYHPLITHKIEGFGTEYVWGLNEDKICISAKESSRHPSIHSSHKLGQVKLTRNKQPAQHKLTIEMSLA